MARIRFESVGKRYPKGMINETTFSDITWALKYASSEKERREWIAALQKELDRLFKDLDVFEWSAKEPGDIGPMKLIFPCKIKTQGDLHNEAQSVKKVRAVSGDCKSKIEGTSGVPIGGWQSFAATIAQTELLHFFSICVELEYHLYSLDVQGAYLHAMAPRNNLLYRPPENIVPPDPSKPYLRAKRALYGWAESGRAFGIFTFWASSRSSDLCLATATLRGCVVRRPPAS